MQRDPGKLSRVGFQFRVQNDPPLAQEAGGVDLLAGAGAEAQLAAACAQPLRPAEADWRAGKAQSAAGPQAYCFGEPVPMYCGSRTSNCTLFWIPSIHSRNLASRTAE